MGQDWEHAALLYRIPPNSKGRLHNALQETKLSAVLNKSHVIEAILGALSLEFENYVATSKKTRSTGNDAQTKSEGKYDTRSTEENYLADVLYSSQFAKGLFMAPQRVFCKRSQNETL